MDRALLLLVKELGANIAIYTSRHKVKTQIPKYKVQDQSLDIQSIAKSQKHKVNNIKSKHKFTNTNYKTTHLIQLITQIQNKNSKHKFKTQIPKHKVQNQSLDIQSTSSPTALSFLLQLDFVNHHRGCQGRSII